MVPLGDDIPAEDRPGHRAPYPTGGGLPPAQRLPKAGELDDIDIGPAHPETGALNHIRIARYRWPQRQSGELSVQALEGLRSPRIEGAGWRGGVRGRGGRIRRGDGMSSSKRSRRCRRRRPRRPSARDPFRTRCCARRKSGPALGGPVRAYPRYAGPRPRRPPPRATLIFKGLRTSSCAADSRRPSNAFRNKG
jgi:hypothetical protein